MLLQAALLTLCTTLCALNQDGSYATLPWLTRKEAGKLFGQTALSKAAKLDALSLQQDIPQHAEQQPMQETAQHTGKQLLTGGMQQPQQQTEQQPMQKAAPYTNVQQSPEQQQLSQEPLQDTEQQLLTGKLPQTQQQVKQQTAGQVNQPYVPQHDKQPVQQAADGAVHEVSSVSNARSGSFFQDVPEEASGLWSVPMVSDKTEEEKEGESREKEEDNNWWWNELIMEKPGSALPVKVLGLSGQEWYAVVVRIAVGLTHAEEPRIRSAATLWFNRAVSP